MSSLVESGANNVQSRELLPYSEGRIPDEEMGNLLAAIGNNEAKALTLLLMQPGRIYTRRDIHDVFIRIQGGEDNAGWQSSHSLQFNYCQNSLAPIGLVAKEVVEGGVVLQTYGYMTTEYGEAVGKHLAALLLGFSRAHPDFSLYDFFGATQSTSNTDPRNKKRAPLERMRILWELVTATLPIRQVDLTERLGKDHRQSLIGNHLRELARKRVIEYNANDGRTEINLSDKQRQVIGDLIEIVDKFQNRDPMILTKGGQLTSLFLTSPGEVSNLMLKTREHSSAANKKPLEEHFATFLSIISRNPGISQRELAENLEQTGERIGRNSIGGILNLLLSTGQVETLRVGVRRYRIPSA